jgi:hypothetical protein
MLRRTTLSLVVLLGVILLGSVVEAGQREPRSGRFRLFQGSPSARPLDQQENPQVQPSRQNPYSYWREIYPQFYGGFHYRQIYEFGPPGDFGFRGSPW